MRVAWAPSPFLDSRNSGHIHATPHASGDRIPEVSIQPAPSQNRSPTLLQTVRRHGLGPITFSRRSKIGPINFPRQHVCKPRCDRKPKISIQPAPSLHRPPTLLQPVLGHGLGPITVSRRSKIGLINFPRQHVWPRYDRKPMISIQPAPSLHRSPTLLQPVLGHGHSPKSVSRRSKIGHVDQPR
jgi:hypothetical protein